MSDEAVGTEQKLLTVKANVRFGDATKEIEATFGMEANVTDQQFRAALVAVFKALAGRDMLSITGPKALDIAKFLFQNMSPHLPGLNAVSVKKTPLPSVWGLIGRMQDGEEDGGGDSSKPV